MYSDVPTREGYIFTGWKDADEMIVACEQKIDELKAKAEAERIAAEKAGFIDNSNFSTIFKKYKGMTPTEYRMKNRQ